VLGGSLWIVIARSLRSVSRITELASAIRAADLRTRLPVAGSNDELDRLSVVLNGLFSEVELSLQQMDAFASDAAHQMRTPLTRIRGELDLVLAGGVELVPEARAHLLEARADLERLVETCARLLLLARLDRGSLDAGLRAEVVDLGALVGELCEQAEPLAAEREIVLHCEAPAGVLVGGCRALLAEGVLNLLENAILFTPAGGRVAVRVLRAGGKVAVSVEDSGPGVSAQEGELVFRRFFRGAASAVVPGTGLGLAIVRGIARAHGGDVRLCRSERSGAEFRIDLPAA
jgi:two-component system OmpR family sensor kinase